MSKAAVYYRSYHRALVSYASSGFLSRHLDAEDVAFVERIRERGYVACGSLGQIVPTTYADDVVHRSAVFEEETEFWRAPYALERSIWRRTGPFLRTPARAPGTTPFAIKRKQDREEVKATQEEEQRKLDQLKREREEQQRRRDAEWDAAAPKAAPFGKTRGRHFVPQWKIDEQRAAVARTRVRQRKFFIRAAKAEHQAAMARLEARRQAQRQAQQTAHERRARQQTVDAVERFKAEHELECRTAAQAQAQQAAQERRAAEWAAAAAAISLTSWPRPAPGRLATIGNWCFVLEDDLPALLSKRQRHGLQVHECLDGIVKLHALIPIAA